MCQSKSNMILFPGIDSVPVRLRQGEHPRPEDVPPGPLLHQDQPRRGHVHPGVNL